jgi:hypothetical protein
VVRHIFQACSVWIYTQSNITSIVQTSVTIYYNHIFKELVNLILQRSVKNILSLLTQRERSIILCSIVGCIYLGVLGEGVLCEILGNYQTKY